MLIRKPVYYLLPVILIVLSGWAAMQPAQPVSNLQKDASSYYRNGQSPESPPEKIQQQVLTGLHLVSPKKTGVASTDVSERIQPQFQAGFSDLFQQQPHWLKSYLRHNYPSHNFW